MVGGSAEFFATPDGRTCDVISSVMVGGYIGCLDAESQETVYFDRDLDSRF